MQVLLHAVFQSEIKRIRNQCMPDGDFQQAGNVLLKILEVNKVEVVPGINAQP